MFLHNTTPLGILITIIKHSSQVNNLLYDLMSYSKHHQYTQSTQTALATLFLRGCCSTHSIVWPQNAPLSCSSCNCLTSLTFKFHKVGCSATCNHYSTHKLYFLSPVFHFEHYILMATTSVIFYDHPVLNLWYWYQSLRGQWELKINLTGMDTTLVDQIT